jgi:hypothetical protein
MSKKKAEATTIRVQGTAISILSEKDGDYISLTDMLKAKEVISSFRTGSEIAIRWSFWEFGSRSSTRILIMANSP